MKTKSFLIILFLLFAILLSGCSGVIPSTGLTGNWTMTNSSGSTYSTAKCYIVDNSGSLTLNNFYIVNNEYTNWNTGYGTFNGSNITATVNGSYTNIYSQTVSIVIYFEGTIDSSGIYGSGTWLETETVGGYIFTYSGNTVLVKG